jgi:hypothetical protein
VSENRAGLAARNGVRLDDRERQRCCHNSSFIVY